MKTSTRIAQSRVRVRSGVKLVAFLLGAAVLGYLLKWRPLWLFSSWFAGFFALVTLLEYWNVRRLQGRPE